MGRSPNIMVSDWVRVIKDKLPDLTKKKTYRVCEIDGSDSFEFYVIDDVGEKNSVDRSEIDLIRKATAFEKALYG